MKQKYLYLLALLSGLILSLAWPMHGFPFLLLFGFVPLFFIEDYFHNNKGQINKYAIFKYLYIAFFTWNILTTWWILNSTIFGAIMAILLNSFFMAIVFFIFHLSKRTYSNPNHSIFLIVFYWIAFEYLHLDWDLSWPWLNLGNGFAMYTRWIQWYEYTGIFGGTLWILISNILFFKVLKSFLIEKRINKTVVFKLAFSILVVIVPMAFSLWIYNHQIEQGEKCEVIVSQPNIDPYSEQYTISIREAIEKNLVAVEPYISDSTVFIICPESALQENIWHNSVEDSRSVVLTRRFLEKYSHLNIIIGASTFRLFDDDEPLTRTARKFTDVDKYYEAYNTALFINQDSPVKLYHKSKLVPGPEKMPFQRLLSPLQNIAFDLGGTVGSLGLSPEREIFTSLDDRFKVPGIICYESVYGAFVSGFVLNGANLLFIITNDGWWGNTAGHRQHFSFAKLRAVETRRNIARSANTGISAIINSRGETLQSSDYWVSDVLKAELITNDKITFYVKYGDYIGRVCTFIALFSILIAFAVSKLNWKN